MSHFSVLVPADDEGQLEAMLLPYMENCCGVPPYDYMQFYDEEDRLREVAQEVITADSWVGERHPEAVGKTMVGYYGQGDFDKFCNEWGWLKRDPLTGRIGYWQNVQARWDWYAVGGRFSGLLKLKEPEDAIAEANLIIKTESGEGGAFNEPNADPNYCDVAPAGLVDWEGMRESGLEKAMDRYRSVCKLMVEIETEGISTLSLEAARLEYEEDSERGMRLRERFPTSDLYARHNVLSEQMRKRGSWFWSRHEWDLLNSPEDGYRLYYSNLAPAFAFIDQEGGWHERGKMSWWGIVSDRQEGYWWGIVGDRQEGYDADFWKFIESLDPNQRLYVVDCHI